MSQVVNQWLKLTGAEYVNQIVGKRREFVNSLLDYESTISQGRRECFKKIGEKGILTTRGDQADAGVPVHECTGYRRLL